MKFVQPELAVRAFNTIEGLKKASALAELEEVIGPLFQSMDFDVFAKACFYSADGVNCQVLHYGRPSSWGAHYIERGYSSKSMIAREMLFRRSAYSWEDVRRVKRIDQDTELILSEAREFGIYDGLFLPVRELDGSFAAVALCSRKSHLADPFVRNVAEVLAAYYASEGDRLAKRQQERRTLSRRQRECLAWTRLGKSSRDIAGILNLSVPTIDGHIAEACRKLGVRTRVQAVVDACLLGLIDG